MVALGLGSGVTVGGGLLRLLCLGGLGLGSIRDIEWVGCGIVDRFFITGVVDARCAPHTGDRGQVGSGLGVQPALHVHQSVGVLFPDPQPAQVGRDVGTVAVLVEQVQQFVGGGFECFGGVAGRCGDQIRFDLCEFCCADVVFRFLHRGADDRDVFGADRSGPQRVGAGGQRRRQHLAGEAVSRSQVLGCRDAACSFLAADPHPGGKNIGPGFAADLVRVGTGHQCRLDAVIDRRLRAGMLLTLGLQRQ